MRFCFSGGSDLAKAGGDDGTLCACEFLLQIKKKNQILRKSRCSLLSLGQFCKAGATSAPLPKLRKS